VLADMHVLTNEEKLLTLEAGVLSWKASCEYLPLLGESQVS